MLAMTYIKRSLEKVTILVMFNLYCCGSDGEKNYKMIYILEWTPSNTVPFPALGKEQEAFIDKSCWFQNCYITNDPSYLNDVSDFDAVVFNVIELRLNKALALPSKRSPIQKYVFVGREPSVYYPLPDYFDGYFNWTWSYRLNSDINFNYVAVRNKRGEVIGPKKDMYWIDINKMKPTSKYIKRKLRNKSIAAAWFVSNCEAKNNRTDFAYNLKRELEKYGQQLDIYGLCGDISCALEGLDEGCKAYIESDYYFYLAFENSFDEDYVTEKLLSALEHFAVPVVFGGANYTRFLPDGIYLDACALGPEKLAREMNDAIQNKRKYLDFFKWHNHYSFHDPIEKADTSGVCELCALLNNEKRRHEDQSVEGILNSVLVDALLKMLSTVNDIKKVNEKCLENVNSSKIS